MTNLAVLDPTKLDPNTSKRVRVYSDYEVAQADQIRSRVLAQLDNRITELAGNPKLAAWHEVRDYLATKVTSVETWIARRDWSLEALMMDAYKRLHGG